MDDCAPDAFRHIPALRGLITPLDATDMRITMARYAELDAQARTEGWPPGWRMEHGAREANRRAVLSDRISRDLWVFAYGSLIWDPAVEVAEYRYAALPGWHRSFCMKLEGGRGSFNCPGLMAALDAGGHCDGIVMRIAAAQVDTETEFMWRREMFAGSYRPLFFDVTTPQGPVEALVFVMDPENRRYLPHLGQKEAARMIALAEGGLGPNIAYLEALVRHLDILGIRDDAMQRLYDLALDIRAGAAPAQSGAAG